MYTGSGRRRRPAAENPPNLRRSPRLAASRRPSATLRSSDDVDRGPRGLRPRALPSQMGSRRSGRTGGFDRDWTPVSRGEDALRTRELKSRLELDLQRSRETSRQPVNPFNEPRGVDLRGTSRSSRLPPLANDPRVMTPPDPMEAFYQRPRMIPLPRPSASITSGYLLPRWSGYGGPPQERAPPGTRMGTPQADMLLGAAPIPGRNRAGTPIPEDEEREWRYDRAYRERGGY